MKMESSLQQSLLSPPLKSMKIRWDGVRPAKGGMLTLNSPRFGMTRSGGTQPHQGVDLAAPSGTAIFAVADGIIEQVRKDHPKYGVDLLLKFRPSNGWIKHLAAGGINDDDGILYAHYAHLTSVVVTAKMVFRGQLLGTTGVSGNADQKYPHLHFEIRKIRWPGTGKDGLLNRINPEDIFPVDFVEPYETLEKLSRTG